MAEFQRTEIRNEDPISKAYRSFFLGVCRHAVSTAAPPCPNYHCDGQSGAGSDLIDTYESLSNQIVIDINAKGNQSWRVDVSKQDVQWPSQFHLYVRRTFDGWGSGTISGGTAYQEVTSVNQSFFNGSKKRNQIEVQLRLSGVSLQVASGSYSTNVYYTVSGI